MLNSRTRRRPLTRLARFWILGVLVLASIVVASLQVAAQTARISGTVVDQAGNVVPNPNVTVGTRSTWQPEPPMRYGFFDQAGNVVRNPDVTMSRSRSSWAQLIGQHDGTFEIFDLEPGEYDVTVRTPGFEPLSRAVSLEAGEQREEELVLTRTPASRHPRTEAETATTGTVLASTGRLAETTGSPVEQEPSSGRLTEFVPVVAAPAAFQQRVQVGPVSASRSAESVGSAAEQEPPSEPSSGRLTEFVPVVAAPVALQQRVHVGSVSASRSAETTGSAVEQEQPSEPSSERIAELVATATDLQEQQQTVLDEQPDLLGDSDRPTGRLDARTGIQGVVIEEATIGPTGEVDDIEEADADGSYKVLATRRASTLERELNAAAAVGYRLQTLTWRVGGSLWGVVPLPGDRREMMAIVARTAQPARFSYRVVPARDHAESKLEARLNEAGEAGFRVREVGTSVILERDEAADPVAREFRVVTTSRIRTLEAEIAAAGRDGYRPVGLTPPAAIEGLVAILSRPTGMDPSAVVP